MMAIVLLLLLMCLYPFLFIILGVKLKSWRSRLFA
jgi:hypothetical protein